MPMIGRRGFMQTTGLAAVGLAAARCRASASAARGRPKIKVGQIGTGHAHASGKMSTFRKLAEDYEVVGVVEPDPGLRRAAEKQAAYRGLRWMTEEQLLAMPSLKAVAVETEVKDLVPTAARCVQAGMHVHLDKPAGQSLSAFRKLLDAAARRRLVVQMGYMFRNNPAFELCFRAIREGWLGRVFELDAVISKMYAPQARKPLEAYPGGLMFELGCHLIDAAVIALGKPRRVIPIIQRTRPEEDQVADNTLAVLEYPEAIATVRSAALEVDGTWRRQFLVGGDRGTIQIRPLEPPRVELVLAEAQGNFRKGIQEVRLPAMPGRYDGQLAELARIIRGEEENKYPPVHDLAVHETILRASNLPVD